MGWVFLGFLLLLLLLLFLMGCVGGGGGAGGKYLSLHCPHLWHRIITLHAARRVAMSRFDVWLVVGANHMAVFTNRHFWSEGPDVTRSVQSNRRHPLTWLTPPLLGTRLTAFTARLTAFTARLTAFAARLTAFTARLTAFAAGLTAFTDRLTAFAARLTAFAARLTAFTAKLLLLG